MKKKKIKDHKLQYDINREAAKISPLSSGKIHKDEYLKGKEILWSGQSGTIEQAKFTYSPLGKAFEKQIKTIEEQGRKQIKPLEEHGEQLLKSKNKKESLTHLKQKNFFKELGNERWKKCKI